MANTSKRLGNLTNTGTGGGGSGTGYVKSFTSPTWVSASPDYSITVPESEHLKGVAPSVEVYELDGGSYRSVQVSIEVSNAGLIVIRVPQSPDNRFAGKIIIS
jgi:hypothetical protein